MYTPSQEIDALKIAFTLEQRQSEREKSHDQKKNGVRKSHMLRVCANEPIEWQF